MYKLDSFRKCSVPSLSLNFFIFKMEMIIELLKIEIYFIHGPCTISVTVVLIGYVIDLV